MNTACAFTAARIGFERAVASRPGEFSETLVTFADRPVSIRIVGRDLARQIVPPIAHLKASGEKRIDAALTVEFWDEQVTGVSFESCRDEVSSESEFRPPEIRFFVNSHQSTTLCLDREAGRIVGFSRSAEGLSIYERGRPFHRPLTEWHNDLGVPVVHAGLVSKGGKGILFAGPAGVGKSTCSVACLCAGFDFLSDDLIALESAGGDAFRGHSLYSSTHFEAHQVRRFPTLAPYATAGNRKGEDKLLVLLHDVMPSRIARTSGIHAILLPEIAHADQSTIEPASRATALLALAPPSLGVNRQLGRQGFEMLGRMVEHVPSFRLRLGRDLDEIAAVVYQFVKDLEA